MNFGFFTIKKEDALFGHLHVIKYKLLYIKITKCLTLPGKD